MKDTSKSILYISISIGILLAFFGGLLGIKYGYKKGIDIGYDRGFVVGMDFAFMEVRQAVRIDPVKRIADYKTTSYEPVDFSKDSNFSGIIQKRIDNNSKWMSYFVYILEKKKKESAAKEDKK